MTAFAMPKTEAYVRERIAAGAVADAAIVIGNKDGETYRFLCSSRGDVLNGQTLFDMMSVTKILAVTPLFLMAKEEGLEQPHSGRDSITRSRTISVYDVYGKYPLPMCKTK